MWANAQRDGRPAEYRWRPLFNATVWLTPTTRVPCSNAAKTRNPLKLHGVPQTNETVSAASGPKFTILWGHVGEILLLNKFFSDCRYMSQLRRYSPTKLSDGAQMAIFGDFLWPPYEIGRPLYFCPVVTIFLSIFFSSPNLSGRRLDVYHTSTHGVPLVWI